MSLTIHTDANLQNLPADAVVVVPYFDGDDLADVADLRALGGQSLQHALSRGEIKSSLFETSVIYSDGTRPSLLIVGAGPRPELTTRTLMKLAAVASRFATGHGWSHLAIVDRGDGSAGEWAEAAVSGAVRGAYEAGIKKTRQDAHRSLDAVSLLSGRQGETLQTGARSGQIIGESANIARDLVNLPANELTPTALAERARELAQQYGLQCRVLDENDMRQLGMGSLLGVAAGSHEPPRLIVLRCGDDNAATKVAFVGKGLTFDSGGLSLKTMEGMMTMKSDMGGAAAVIAGMVALARLGISGISMTGYAGATENMPGGGAMRPGDVLTAMNGETIEVLNTDAEGRLVLADVLSYAIREGATHIVDFATLTGAAVIALGRAATLATGKPMDWVRRVVDAADRGLDRSWPMPLYAEYRQAMDSSVADIKNVGGREGGALTAAAFLSDFAVGVNWCHMDIAGTAWNDKASAEAPEGGTGVGVGTVVSVAREMAGG